MNAGHPSIGATDATGAIDPIDATGPVGVIGLGLVGTALGQRLARAGHEVIGFDRSADACAAWAHKRHEGDKGDKRDRGAGGRIAASPREIGRACARVVIAVFDSAGVLEVTEGHGDTGLLEGGCTKALFDCSTGDPDILQALAARLAARGVEFVEAPLAGSSRQIAEGTATMLLGGDAGVIARHAALLEALSPQRIHVGGAGMGARAKLATNLVLGLNRAALAEGLVFAEKLGIPAATFLDLVLATPARSDAALAKGELMVRGDFAAPQSRIHQHLKDVQLMLDAARAAQQRLPLTEAHAELLRAAVAAGDGELDNAAIVRQLRRENR